MRSEEMVAGAASGRCRHLLLQPHDIIFAWTQLLGKSHDIRLARKVGGILPFWNGSAPMCVFSPSLSPDQDPLPVTARSCTLQGCHSKTIVLLTATEAGGCSEPTTLATAYSAEPCVLQLRRSREKHCPSRGCHRAWASVQRAVQRTPWSSQCSPEDLLEQLEPEDLRPHGDAECQSRRSQQLGFI